MNSKEIHPSNIDSILVNFEVSKFKKSIYFKEKQPENREPKSVI